MRRRELRRLARMLEDPPQFAPEWLTPEQVVAATPLDGLDLLARLDQRNLRILLLAAVARTALRKLQRDLD